MHPVNSLLYRHDPEFSLSFMYVITVFKFQACFLP